MTILVRPEAMGLIQESWTDLTAAFRARRTIDGATLILASAFAATFFLMMLAGGSLSVLRRHRELLVLAAVGWRRSSLYLEVLFEWLAIVPVLTALGLGSMLAHAAITHQPVLSTAPILVGLVAGCCLGAYAAGAAIPTLASAASLLLSEPTMTAPKGRFPVHSLAQLAMRNVLMRYSGNLRVFLVIAVSAFVVVSLGDTMIRTHGTIAVSAFGRYLSARLLWYHYGLALGTTGLAIITLSLHTLASILHRRSEFALLAALGWRDGSIIRLLSSRWGASLCSARWWGVSSGWRSSWLLSGWIRSMQALRWWS